MFRFGIRVAFYAVSLSVFACGCCAFSSGRATGPSRLLLMKDLASRTESITIYDLKARSGKSYTQEQLESATQVPFAPELFRELLKEAEYRDRWVLWMGSRLAVLRMSDGSEARLALSYSGDFFALLGTPGYFYFKGAAAEKWEDVFHDKIIQETFIPERIRRKERSQGGGS
jgi:hypothetical protein